MQETSRIAANGPETIRSNGPRRILIVDDSLTVRMDLRQTFESAGFAVALCETLANAHELLVTEAPDLVVLDVLLPDGDGLDLLGEIKTTLAPALPVMLLSTEAEVSDRARGLKTGADDYVGKPYDAAYVLKRAGELIAAVQGPRDSPTTRILLIDDSMTSRHQFQSILESAGYSVIAAETGEEGLSAAIALRPDAIIVDRVLSGGIDGDAVVRRVKQDVTLRNTPCLLLTGSTGQEEELRMLDAGADAFLLKDVDPGVFVARMEALIRSATPALPVDAPVSSLLAAKKILAVDDSITYLNALSGELRKEGYDVIQALSGEEALALLDVQPVDCVLLDVWMPGLSGYDTCRAIKSRPAARSVPVLMLTGAEGTQAFVDGINAGADDYISKSGDATVLRARVRAQLRRKQFEDEHRFMRDQLQRKELEAAQARAEREIAEARAALVDELELKNRELDAFAHSAAHDLRNPLRTISGFTRILMEDFSSVLPPGAVAHLDKINRAAVRMGQLIDALLEFSRAARLESSLHTVDLSELARSVGAELADANPGRQVSFSAQDGLTSEGDPQLLRVVLQNLLGNAWKFTSKAQQPVVTVGALERGGQRVFFVQDNGVGFDSTRAARLFQPFERLHPATEFPGVGIGLATVRRIIERHRGKIWAESAPGQGAKLWFTLGPPSGRAAAPPGNRLALQLAEVK